MTTPAVVITQALRCADLFRLGRDIEAALIMVELIDTAMPLMTARSPADQHAFGQVLNTLLNCQERQDWIGVADGLEFEFLPLLETYR